MSLRLISNPHPIRDQCIIRLMRDVVSLKDLSRAEVRARYDDLELIRDALSEILDRVDGKR